MTRNKEEYEELEREARKNTWHKSFPEMADELALRVNGIVANLESHSSVVYRNQLEIENDIVKSIALAKKVLSRLENAEHWLEATLKNHKETPSEIRKRTQEEQFKEQEKFMAKNKKNKSVKIKVTNGNMKDEVSKSAYYAAGYIVSEGSIGRASETYIKLQSENTEMADYFWKMLGVYLEEMVNIQTGEILFKAFQNRVKEDREHGTYQDIKVEEKELNNFELLQKMTKAGPLSTEEAKRRGDIVLYNHIYDLFVSAAKDAKNYNEGSLLIHPETIQIMGYYGLALLELGGTVGRRVGVDHI